MRRLFKTEFALTLSAAAAAGALALFAAPAHATTGNQAISACNARPNCVASIGSAGDVVINADNPDGTTTTIWCDGREGDCVVVARETRPRREMADAVRPDELAGASAGTANTTASAPARRYRASPSRLRARDQ